MKMKRTYLDKMVNEMDVEVLRVSPAVALTTNIPPHALVMGQC
jgi:hypothetical protein